jgi:hypothetical protein
MRRAIVASFFMRGSLRERYRIAPFVRLEKHPNKNIASNMVRSPEVNQLKTRACKI